MKMTRMKARQRGVTLIELMIVVAIVGILAAIAYPSYRQQVMRSTRTEARVALEQRALALEKCFTRLMRYDTCPAGLAAADANTADGHFRITITQPLAQSDFRLTATALGAQGNDTPCATMQLDAQGRRTPVACW